MSKGAFSLSLIHKNEGASLSKLTISKVYRMFVTCPPPPKKKKPHTYNNKQKILENTNTTPNKKHQTNQTKQKKAVHPHTPTPKTVSWCFTHQKQNYRKQNKKPHHTLFGYFFKFYSFISFGLCMCIYMYLLHIV